MEMKKSFVTRGIKRRFNEILLNGVEVGVDGKIGSINPSNGDKANDYMVMSMYEISQDELDNLSEVEFNKMLDAINKLSPL